MNYEFFKPCGDEEDKRILEAVKNNQSLPDVSFMVICHSSGEWWNKEKDSGRPFLRRKFNYCGDVYYGPMFKDEDGNEYETYLYLHWKGEKLTEKQQIRIELAFQDILKRSKDVIGHRVFLQPLRENK